MKKILFLGMTPLHGGVESFLINYYHHMDHQKLHFDFLCNFSVPIACEEELRRDGCRVYHITPKRESFFRYQKELHAFFKEHGREYDVFWQNVNELANIEYLVLARRYGIPKRIIHSHNSRSTGGIRQKILHRLNKSRIDRYATDFWACSESAAKWFYRPALIQKAVIIHNAIDLQKYSFDRDKRRDFRDRYVHGDAYAIGHVGRLNFQKNQSFLLEIFKAFTCREKDAVLFLVGEGEDLDSLQQKVQALGLEKQVFFMGNQNDMQGWLSCFDLFLFPSLFEGLSIAALEAQANGVPVLASKGVVPEQLRLNDNFHFFSLDNTAEEWAEEAIQIKGHGKRVPAGQIRANFQKAGFDISTEALKVQKMLLE
jgi:glycosyltransferase involved in cell wall biosynthesis